MRFPVCFLAEYRATTIDHALPRNCTLIIALFILISRGKVASRMQWIILVHVHRL